MRFLIVLFLLVICFLPACNSPVSNETLVEMKKNNDSLNRELSEKNEEVYLLRDSIRIAQLRDSVKGVLPQK